MKPLEKNTGENLYALGLQRFLKYNMKTTHYKRKNQQVGLRQNDKGLFFKRMC